MTLRWQDGNLVVDDSGRVLVENVTADEACEIASEWGLGVRIKSTEA